jgi:hypothetical protein
MSHPMNSHRQHRVEKMRVGNLCKGYDRGGKAYAKGGAVKSIGKKALSLHADEHKALHAEGHESKHRMDRPHRAKGGKVGKKGNSKTIVNVITGGHPAGGAAPPMPPGPPMGIAGPPPGGAMPPPGAPPGIRPPMPGPGMPPPGGPPMPQRAKGGRVQTPTGTGVAAESSRSKENRGSPVFNASLRHGTKVSHQDGKDDQKNIGRGRVVTFACGGGVKSFRAYGGKVESPQGVAKSTRLPGGSGGGEARLVKASRARRDYHGPD